ncbi:MAG: phage virion morphogenesis protein [Methylobacteriaceae bacterium]|jgi:hypothetical protein|nr:phage virion morphogenesis protein [Methylobacteriaceae bacterium]
MAGAGISFTISDREVRAAFLGLERAMRNTTPVMKTVGLALVKSTRKRFDTKLDPEGGAWAPLSPLTNRRKKKPFRHPARERHEGRADDFVPAFTCPAGGIPPSFLRRGWRPKPEACARPNP